MGYYLITLWGYINMLGRGIIAYGEFLLHGKYIKKFQKIMLNIIIVIFFC